VKSEILYGFHPVYEALVAARRHVFEIFIEKGKASKRHEKIAAIAESRNLPLKMIVSAQIESMAVASAHQGVAARVSAYPLVEMSAILDLVRLAEGAGFLLLLDNILDPHNLGAIIRTASCVGIEGVVIPKDRSVPPTPSVSKTSAGALEHVKMARVNNLVRTVKMLKENGLWIIGMDQTAQQNIYSIDLTGPLAVIIGGEEKGIRPLVKRNCDFLLSIPQIGPIGSLNASVAAAIVLYESFRQRQTLSSEKSRKESE
jgi:23S rRNA (guanosine2251-2'-O)-methyltransferase